MKKTIILILAAFVTLGTAATATEMTNQTAPTARKQKKEKAEIKEVTFDVSIHCKNCYKKLQENLSYEKGVKGLHICMEDQIVYFKYDASKTNEETLKNAIIKLGVPVQGKKEAGHHHNH